MNPFESYKLYLALKNHFTKNNYDYFKYQGKVKANVNSFETRKDKWHFYRLSKKDNPRDFLLANALVDNINWIGDIMTPEGDTNYIEWKKRQGSLTYNFKTEVGRLKEDFNENFMCKEGQHPSLFKQYRQGDVSIETMIILNDIVKFFPHWDKNITDTILWPPVKMLCQKYKPFLKYDIFEMKKILKERFD